MARNYDVSETTGKDPDGSGPELRSAVTRFLMVHGHVTGVTFDGATGEGTVRGVVDDGPETFAVEVDY